MKKNTYNITIADFRPKTYMGFGNIIAEYAARKAKGKGLRLYDSEILREIRQLSKDEIKSILTNY